MRDSQSTISTHLRNFSVFAAAAILLLAGLSYFRSHAPGGAAEASLAGVFLFLLKAGVKLLPLLLTLLVEFGLALNKREFLMRLTAWRKSRRIDLYGFILSHLHKLMALLKIAFTLGIPLLLDYLVRDGMPSEFSLFVLFERLAGYPLAILAFVLIATFCNYWEHRLWHSALLWPIHRFHHSATDYNVLIETRKHFTEVLMTPLFFTLPMILLGAPLEFVLAYLALVLFQGFMSHTDQSISYGWIGQFLWIDPVYHKLHHSLSPDHINKNFSGTLPLWDRLFGTYAHADHPIEVGVSDGPHYATQPIWKIYLIDFSELLQNLGGAVKEALGRRGGIQAAEE
ncbi:sterol desaturase family protein [Janthinobacterium sp. 17J80-10]|uniref:sterol desaturase family protein n=1 Tax=Janthinobacterium sp. 17J80-10 TaxID=2497863 RepID=UPI0010055FE3|nr:sterol desaturase family protein [Janthinobacterium sp. 17J80-10]QAU34543.1 fatty acid hydroxylase family protein [Janthinobacterium sp. 17J80-10]